MPLLRTSGSWSASSSAVRGASRWDEQAEWSRGGFKGGETGREGDGLEGVEASRKSRASVERMESEIGMSEVRKSQRGEELEAYRVTEASRIGAERAKRQNAEQNSGMRSWQIKLRRSWQRDAGSEHLSSDNGPKGA